MKAISSSEKKYLNKQKNKVSRNKWLVRSAALAGGLVAGYGAYRGARAAKNKYNVSDFKENMRVRRTNLVNEAEKLGVSSYTSKPQYVYDRVAGRRVQVMEGDPMTGVNTPKFTQTPRGMANIQARVWAKRFKTNVADRIENLKGGIGKMRTRLGTRFRRTAPTSTGS